LTTRWRQSAVRREPSHAVVYASRVLADTEKPSASSQMRAPASAMSRVGATTAGCPRRTSGVRLVLAPGSNRPLLAIRSICASAADTLPDMPAYGAAYGRSGSSFGRSGCPLARLNRAT
jgi:hypothetical protein